MRQRSEQLPVDLKLDDADLIDVSEKQDRGCLKKILKEGTDTDTPFTGSQVTVHYVGRLLDGSIFDSSRTRSEPFVFELGRRKVIKGWDTGVATMKKGELCELVCTPEYAYGKQGSGTKIPPDSTLVFQVELLAWEDEDVSPISFKKGRVMRRIRKAGSGYSTPNEGAKCKVRIVGKYEGKTFDEREVDFILGECEESGLISAFDHFVKKMKEGETSLMTADAAHAFGQEGKSEWGIPPDAQVTYDVSLTKLEKAKETWAMSVEEKLEGAEKAKEQGTACFNKSSFVAAVKAYERMGTLLATDPEFKEENEEKRKKLLTTSHLNLAMTHLKRNDFTAARKAADEALTSDSKNVKALYRRGMANIGLKDLEDAKVDFKQVIKIEPDNKAAKQQLAVCVKGLKDHAEKQKKTFQGMFDKFAAQDHKTGPAATASGDVPSFIEKKDEATA